ncbi:post-transcriptional regulator [Pullulanibacillus sp. KACC 23026]|uniref:post-transcriptional regulator n=1 Tax=Pullulanibacillus sp. KACC 23026 TaxID=3028315 RepID=UPI0023AF67AF|nr:post-transcriptional regulator [Pullulanibacillus sp. KACC 23026]WEG14076.1 post-transcriptional regulator [Pullulanibacillus sp. KACC 23026]
MEQHINIEELDQIRHHIEPFLVSKFEEFQLLGIESLSMDELWSFILESMKKKKLKDPMLHELVNFIMRLSVNDYLNKIRLEMFKGVDLNVFSEPT